MSEGFSQNNIGRMRLKDKLSLCSGKDAWHTKAFNKYGIPSIMMSDGPHGLRKQTGSRDTLGVQESVKATCFPTAVLTACSFDTDLLGTLGAALAEEAGAQGVGMLLGPGINIKRNPLCGRNFEYFSEDPYLAGKLAAAYINGVQEKGIGTSLKHFASNNQEHARMTSDSIVDERTLRELYLRPFEIAVREGTPSSVMAAYNLINGVWCCENSRLLHDILRVEWGYGGLVVTDWNAVGDRSRGFQAGCDLVMPGGSAYGEKDALRNIRKGVLPESDADASVARVFRLVYNARSALENDFHFSEAEHHALARRIAEESAVLLKNEGSILPFENPGEIAVFGYMAEDFRYQGYGSSRVNPTRVDQILTLWPDVAHARGCNPDGSATPELLMEAASLAARFNKAVIFAGLPGTYETEGIDRDNMRMPEGHIRLIEAVSAVNHNTVVVLCCGGAVELPWADKVKAILYMGLSGQAGAQAAVNLLTGVSNPCGKLAETWPVVYEDCPSASYYNRGQRVAEYREGVYVGYRFYQKAGASVRYPFGAGLSYTSFSYSDLRVGERSVSAVVTNTGVRSGAETAMLFIRPPEAGIHRPVRELKGFCKVFLSPAESKNVEFPLDERSFAVWLGGWTVFSGVYLIEVGPNSENLPLQAAVTIPGEDAPVSQGEAEWAPDRDGWLRTLDKQPEIRSEKPYTESSTVKEASQGSRLLRLIRRIYAKQQARLYGYDSVEYRAMTTMADESTLRAVQNELGLKRHAALALADLANHKPLKAIWHMLF
jgi:beta-glucosidase